MQSRLVAVTELDRKNAVVWPLDTSGWFSQYSDGFEPSCFDVCHLCSLWVGHQLLVVVGSRSSESSWGETPGAAHGLRYECNQIWRAGWCLVVADDPIHQASFDPLDPVNGDGQLRLSSAGPGGKPIQQLSGLSDYAPRLFDHVVSIIDRLLLALVRGHNE
ncbi:hypothetical protein [Mesorhizobium sp. dw_380]|uniref:hypothetical protein n=1 Tax=Mesorhizobium sp. dw_380 TaxID=2812001 RepID=UPI001BDF2577|nr:hypothetical protein [Mesorhizobium sp. dw_380]